MSKHITSAEYRRMMGVSAAPAASAKQMARGLTAHRAGSMNKTERQYQEHLESRKRIGEIIWFKFEALKLRLADKTFLTPDFLVQLPDGLLELHDVKGFMQEDANVKLKVAAATYPFTFRIVRRIKREWEICEI